MKSFLDKKINWMVVFVSLILFAIFIAVVLPKVSAYTEEAVGGMGSPDTSLLYSGRDLYEIAKSYGEEGRSNYVVIRWTFDVLWPLAYLFFLLSTSVQLAKPMKSSWLGKLYWFSILAAGFDYLENTLVTIIMVAFPEELFGLGNIASIASLFKWIWLSLAFAAVLLLLLVRIIRLFRSQNP